MPFNARCWRLPPGALAAATIFLNACARVDSNRPASVCPPVVDYSRVEQAQAADEIAAVPENARIVDWLADYAVLRAQVRACG